MIEIATVKNWFFKIWCSFNGDNLKSVHSKGQKRTQLNFFQTHLKAYKDLESSYI